jgi:hypothetical protein
VLSNVFLVSIHILTINTHFFTILCLYLFFPMFSEHKFSTLLKAAETQSLAEQNMSYKEILRSRGRIFFTFLKKIPTIDHNDRPEGVENHYLLEGIRALCEFRLASKHNHHNMILSDSICQHLMRGIDTTGNSIIDEQEFLNFLMPTTQHLKKKSSQTINKSDLHYRSVQELVELLEKANEKLKKAGISVEGNDPTDNPQATIERTKQELLESIGCTALEREEHFMKGGGKGGGGGEKEKVAAAADADADADAVSLFKNT